MHFRGRGHVKRKSARSLIARFVDVDQLPHVGVDQTGGQNVIWKGYLRKRIANYGCPEIPRLLGLGGDGPRSSRAGPKDLSIFANEKEQLVLIAVESNFRERNRTPNISAKVVPAQLRLADTGAVEGTCLQLIVPPIFIHLAMKSLGPATDGQVYYRSRTSSGFRAKVAGQYADFANRIGIDVDEIIPAPAIVFVIGSVQIPRRRIGASPVDRLAAVVHAESAE